MKTKIDISEHCDRHDHDATNGCPHCVREQLTEEFGIAPHEVVTLVSDLCAFWDTAMHAGLVAPGRIAQYIGLGKLAREGAYALAKQRCEDPETALAPPPELTDDEVRALMTAPSVRAPSLLDDARRELAHAEQAASLGDRIEHAFADSGIDDTLPVGTLTLISGLLSGDMARLNRAVFDMTGQLGLRPRLLALLRARLEQRLPPGMHLQGGVLFSVISQEVDHPPDVQARVDADMRAWNEPCDGPAPWSYDIEADDS